MGVKIILLKNFAKKNFAKKIYFSSLNMYHTKSGVKNFSLWGGGGVPLAKVAQNELKQILVLEFLRSDDFQGAGSLCEIQTDVQPDNRTHAIVTR